MINSIQAPVNDGSLGISVVTPGLVEIKETETLTLATSIETTQISTLSRQLSESAARADARDKSMSRSELGEFAMRVKAVLLPDLDLNTITHSQKNTDRDDPELLTRDKLATEFLAKERSGDSTGKNPFTGLSREQLTFIIYDEGGPYTANERRAAYSASQDIEQQWRAKAIGDSWVEGASGGKTPKFFTELLAHYRSLPLIEKAQLPADYEAQLQAWLDDALSGEKEPKEDDFLNLVQLLAKQRQPERKDKEVGEADAEPKTHRPSSDTPLAPVARQSSSSR